MVAIFESLEANHILFNAKRTLRTANSSKFELAKFKDLTLLKDGAVGFANQIWGIDQHSVIHLPDALACYAKINMTPEIVINQANLTLEIKVLLESLNFEIVEQLNFLSIDCADICPTTPDLQVGRLLPDDVELFLDLLNNSGMQVNKQIWEQKKHLYCTEQFRCFVATIDGVPRALATNFISGEFGLLANAYTQKAYQNRGCQTALLNARLNDANKLGLKKLIVDVVPNTSSERNCLKLGFKPLETRTIWQKKA